MSGNEQVDVVRKGDFHLAFFFKKMNAAHGVLLKEVEKTFPKQKATTSSGSSSSSKRRRTEDPGVVRLEEEEEGAGGIEVKPDPEDEEANGLGGLPAPGQGLDSDNDEEDDEGFTMHPGAMYEDEDTKPKFKLKVRYNGFQM
ncbi:hypothetical protein BDZ90DRAFT_63093 [Jaminaea rosea]|uniref:Uncharacterized protein n=1 Tax=Jaminaea rosea TaxID=1569628 RepID=A0A316ULI7_9BASI|nr:hypothetical protein BDZ90DRAFT_63093 [Jaminaea rosea]PWN25804.1 hypothetical protein BDZ90DRAFT_63093 [Jaminaea rosea]